MATYNPYQSDTTWGSDPYQRLHPYSSQHMKLLFGGGVAVGVGMGMFKRFPGSNRTGWQNAYRGIKLLEETAGIAGGPIIGGMLKTLRYSSMYAPMGAPDVFKIPGKAFFKKEYIPEGKPIKKWAGTPEYWELITGKSRSELKAAGIFEHGLEFRRYTDHPYNIKGGLYVGGKEIAKDIIPLASGGGTDPMFLSHLSLMADTDPKARQVLDKLERLEKNELEEIFGISRESGAARKVPTTPEEMRRLMKSKVSHTLFSAGAGKQEYVFGKSLTGGTLVTGARTRLAFGAQRLGLVLEPFLSRIPGVGGKLTSLLPKRSSAMLMHGKWAALGGLALGAYGAVEQFDWYKRQHPVGGSAAYGGIAGVGTLLASGSPRIAGAAALGTAAATQLPLFKGGIKEGLAEMYMTTQLARSYVTDNPFTKNLPIIGSNYRQWIEETMPGASEPTTAVAVGGLALLGSAIGYKHKTIRDSIENIDIWKRPIGALETPYLHQWRNVMKSYGFEVDTFRGMIDVIKQGDTGRDKLGRKLSFYEAAMKSFETSNDLFKRNITPARQLQNRIDEEWAAKVFKGKWHERIGAQLEATLHGADIARVAKKTGGWKAQKVLPLGKYALPFVVGAGVWAIATGQLAAKKTPEELKGLMAGEEMVDVMAGRWWEAGGTPWKGTHIKFQKPHWFAMMKSQARDKALWGDDATMSPLRKFFIQTFTYGLEERNYYDRPHLISGQSEIPFMSALAAPITNLIKPARLMHVEDFARYGSAGPEIIHDINSKESQPAIGLGGFGPGAPISPYSGRAKTGEQVYQWMEQAGLPGYMMSSGFGMNPLALQQLIGTDSLYSEDTWLSSANEMSSMRNWWWEKELGGGLFSTEVIRRYLPRKRSSIGLYNPLANSQPSWMSEDLRRGDPMSRLPFGYARLAGAGYEALNPELAGMDAENYPLEYQYEILSDVAAYSEEFRSVQSRARRLMVEEALSEAAVERIERADKRRDRKQDRLDFDRYIDKYNQGTADWSLPRRFIGKTWQRMTHGIHRVTDPVEYALTPLTGGFRPIQKLMPYRSPVEHYEAYRMGAGTQMAFWDEPIRDWLKPTAWSILNSMGFDGVDSDIQYRADTEEYYDKLEYFKWFNLARQAEISGDERMAREYRRMSRKTVTGRNPYEQDVYVRSSVPRPERDYFDAFVNTTSPKERERILEIVPPYMRSVYVAQWNIQDYQATGDQELGELIQRARLYGGMPIDEGSYSLYQKENPQGMSYAEWYKAQELDEYFVENPLPRPDFVGWSPDVDLQDVKLKMLLDEGANIHDYGLWDSQVRLLARKPYINDDTIEEVRPSLMNELGDLRRIGNEFGLSDLQVQSYNYYGISPRHDIEVDLWDNRLQEVINQRKLLGL